MPLVKWIGIIYVYFYLPLSVLGRDDLLKLEIPENHATQELYKAFKNEPKEEHVAERMSDLVASAASERERREEDPFTGECVRDFSLPCPESWTKTGTVCEAPSSYKGDCERSVDMSDFTVERKMLFMSDCKVQWPCKSLIDKVDVQYCKDTERNFLQPCPENFLRHKTESGYVCVPDFSGYVGPCRSVVDFTKFSKESKMLWAQTCGTTWPCMTICPKVFDKCPMDWTMAPDGACDAPASYNGPCEKRIRFTYYTQEMKRKRLMECEIPFECTSECEKDYSQCPVLWKTEADGFCVAPMGTFNCNDILVQLLSEAGKGPVTGSTTALDLRLLDAESRKLYESKCSNVEFPCLEREEDINWSLQCPRGWTISKDDLNSCVPPVVNEDDVCKSPMVFTTEEEKRAFASMCDINWSGTAPESKTVTAAVEHHIDGPINEIGVVHAMNKDSTPEILSTKDGKPSYVTVVKAEEPKEASVTFQRKRSVYNIGPFVTRKTARPERKLYKGFTRETHLMPGST